MKRKLVIILVTVIIAMLLFGGGALAYNVLWSGKASITIEAPTASIEGEAELALRVTEVSAVSGGTFDDGFWTVSVKPGKTATLYITIENPRTTYAIVEQLVNGELQGAFNWRLIDPEGDKLDIVLIAGTPNMGDGHVILAGESKTIMYQIRTGRDAQPGVFPDVLLEIREISSP